MNLMFFNARSITHKTQEIDLFTSTQKIDLAIIAESRLKENQDSPFNNTIVNISAKEHQGGILAFSPSGKLNNSLLLSSGHNWQIIQLDDLIIGLATLLLQMLFQTLIKNNSPKCHLVIKLSTSHFRR